METPSHEAVLRIDREAVKAHALALREAAIASAWKQLMSKVSGLIGALLPDAMSRSGKPGLPHFGRPRHRSG